MNVIRAEQVRLDVIKLCQYIFDTEADDYEEQKRELGDDADCVVNHAYAIAERVYQVYTKKL